ncbi:unnamed protein product [Aphis gossypii]|uniref:Uncharacterized protein n=1 Tax=Aphis gossypii TaxID=80765 RepID=A0A9P0NI05_APHGO|nr:unnamed protein product [Aphis gossypii]
MIVIRMLMVVNWGVTVLMSHQLQYEQNTESEHDGQQVHESRLFVPGEHLEEHDVQQSAGGQSLQDDGHPSGRSVHGAAGAALHQHHADDDAHGRDQGERGHVHDEHGPPGLGPGQFQADAEGDDQLVRGHGDEQVPHVVDALLQPYGQALEHLVERQRQHGEQAAERVAAVGPADAVAVQLHLFLGVFVDSRPVRRQRGRRRRRAGPPARRPVPLFVRLAVVQQLLVAGHRHAARHRGHGTGRASAAGQRGPRYGHGPTPQAHRPVQHLLRGAAIRVTGRAPVQHRVHDLVHDEHHEEPGAEYQVAQVLGALSVGQLSGLLQPADALPDLGLQVQQRGEQQHAAAEAQQQRHGRRTGGRVAAVRVAGVVRRRGRRGRGVHAPPLGQLQRHDAQDERAQAQDEHGERLGHDYLVDERRRAGRRRVVRHYYRFGHDLTPRYIYNILCVLYY